MKKLSLIAVVVLVVFTGCGPTQTGELTGVPGRRVFSDPEPFEMAFIPAGSFVAGPSDEDHMAAMNAMARTVTVDAFWMDQTEMTNNKYRQFVHWVRDSILRTRLGEYDIPGYEFFKLDSDGNVTDPPVLNWNERIDDRNEEVQEVIETMYYPPNERFNNRAEYDTRILNYSYFWVDYQQAARSRYNFRDQEYEGQVAGLDGEISDVQDRSSFIMSDVVNVYPDTLVWIRDFTYSYNEPLANLYFWHPSYDEYPVVGVSWVQARAFSIWRTNLMNSYLRERGHPGVHDYRLPSEIEWEYAARGGLAHSMYPWGGPYTRNWEGCFLANFKPLRGNYIDDGSVYTARVASYEPNEFGLYDMAGNVAEWTISAYHTSAYVFTHDLNPNYEYNALPDDPEPMKRKVVRGGSWKDVAYFLQVSSRDFEYQDSTKSYIGFRNVRTYIGIN